MSPLAEVARVMATSPTARQRRDPETLTEISAETNSTMLFPVSIDLIRAFLVGRQRSGG